MGWAIALHGGAGDIAERIERAESGLRHCLQIGVAALRESRSALDVAEIVGVDTTDMKHFITEENVERLRQARATHTVQVDFSTPTENICHQETVGCVVVDSLGNCVAATSTGGLVNKMVGRIGDTPVVGAGNYANHLCAVSATGRGEYIIRATVARDVAALMEYKGFSLEEAANYVIGHMEKGTCGLIAVSCNGEVAMPLNTSGMFRACATEDGYSEVGILA